MFPFLFYVQVLFEPKQWDYLVDQFKQEFCRLYGMTLEPLLNIYLQAGLSALKTPYPWLLTTFLFLLLCVGEHYFFSLQIMLLLINLIVLKHAAAVMNSVCYLPLVVPFIWKPTLGV